MAQLKTERNEKSRRTRLSAHGRYRTEYHIVWTTKYRHSCLLSVIKMIFLRRTIAKIVGEIKGCELVECHVGGDHIHLVLIIPPKYAVSDVVGKIKGRTSSELLKTFEGLKHLYWKHNSMWASGYYVGTVGPDDKPIIEYVRNQ